MTSFNSIGDLSRTFQLRLGQSSLKSRLDQLTQEMMTGIKTDVPKALGGDLHKISHIEGRLAMLSSFQLNASEAQAQFQAMQTALESIKDTVDDLGPSLLTQAGGSDENQLRSQLGGIEQNFRSMFSTLNTNVAGRYLFSGSRSDTAPLGSFDDMMTALGTQSLAPRRPRISQRALTLGSMLRPVQAASWIPHSRAATAAAPLWPYPPTARSA